LMPHFRIFTLNRQLLPSVISFVSQRRGGELIYQ
jgi:hypothetical protein